MWYRNRLMIIVFVIVCMPIFLTGCPIPGSVVGPVCQALEGSGGSPAPGLCPAPGQSANPDFVIIPSPGTSGSIVIIGGNGPSSPGASGQFTLQNPQTLPPISVAVGSSVNILCADGTSPTGSKGVGIGGEGLSYTGTSTAPNGANAFTIIPGAASVTGTVVGSQSVKFYCDNPPIPSQVQINVTAASSSGGSPPPGNLPNCGFGRRLPSVMSRRTQATCANGITPPPSSGAVKIAGQNLVDSSGNQIALHGVNLSGTEYSCIHNTGIFAPSITDTTAVVQAIKTWTGVNAVRIPLNETCWLGINGAPAAYSGTNYQTAIKNFVDLLAQNNLVAILDLHWVAPGTKQATDQQPMPDQDHSVTFWTQVATMFGSNTSVIFDLFNEPFPDNGQSTGWACLKNGGTCFNLSYQAAGMQQLVTAVRGAGAKNVLMSGGLSYSNDLSGWLANEPSDPLNNLAASFHMYADNGCNNVGCWSVDPANIAAKVPLIVGEFGTSYVSACPASAPTTIVSALMDWMDTKKESYIAWDWDAVGSCISLVTDVTTGAPSANWGTVYKTHVAKF
jgi:endoglucanase